MNKAEKKFVLYAVLAIFVSLTVLLAVVNIVTFTMAAQDADRITERLSQEKGKFREDPPEGSLKDPDQFVPMGPMGPTSPEIGETIRYFTVNFAGNGKVKMTVFRINAVTEDEAKEWAESLLKESTGWTRGTYRFRVYHEGNDTFVTVIDQGRELLSCYRILLVSLIGDLVMVVISFFVLRLIGKALFAPLEEADRKQKRFLESVEKEFKVPLTVISANTELLDREHGPGDETAAIRSQVKKMNQLVGGLSTFTVFGEDGQKTDLQKLVLQKAEEYAPKFEEAGKTLTVKADRSVCLQADAGKPEQILAELLENMLKYGEGEETLSLSEENGRILLKTLNRAALPDGSMDRAFDRNTVLENGSGLGAGLANVKELVKSMNGRVNAESKDGFFTVSISF